jgi:hypothetical protein
MSSFVANVEEISRIPSRVSIRCERCRHAGIVSSARVNDMLTCLQCGYRAVPRGWVPVEPPPPKPTAPVRKAKRRLRPRRGPVEATPSSGH